MEAIPKSDIKSVIKSDISFDISIKPTTWIGHKGVGGFQKSYVIFGGGMSKYLLFLTGVVWKRPKIPLRNIKMAPNIIWSWTDGSDKLSNLNFCLHD